MSATCGISGATWGRSSGSWSPSPAASGRFPFPQLAEVSVASGPAMIRNEDGLLTGYVYVDIAGPRPGGLHRGGRPAPPGKGGTRRRVTPSPGAASTRPCNGSGARLEVVVPLTLLLILGLLYLNTRSLAKTAHHPAGGPVLGHRRRLVPLSPRLQHEHRGLGRPDRPSGVDAETGVFMLLYLDLAYAAGQEGGAAEEPGGPAAGDSEGRGQADPAQVDDRGHHVPGASPDHVGHRDRLGRHEAHRRPHGRRHLDLLSPGTVVYPVIYEIWKWHFEDQKERRSWGIKITWKNMKRPLELRHDEERKASCHWAVAIL